MPKKSLGELFRNSICSLVQSTVPIMSLVLSISIIQCPNCVKKHDILTFLEIFRNYQMSGNF